VGVFFALQQSVTNSGTLDSHGKAAEESALIALEERKIILVRHSQKRYDSPCRQTGVKTASAPVKFVPVGRFLAPWLREIVRLLEHQPTNGAIKFTHPN
jgi:hypothetical protein